MTLKRESWSLWGYDSAPILLARDGGLLIYLTCAIKGGVITGGCPYDPVISEINIDILAIIFDKKN